MALNADRLADFERNERLTFNAGAVLVSLMMLCLGITARQFLARLSPEWELAFLPWMVMVVAAEAIYSQYFVHRWSDFSPEKISYRVSEFLVIVFLVKAVFYLRMGAEASRNEIARYGAVFFEAFLSREYVTVLIVCFLAWLVAARMADMLLEMGRDRQILEPWARPDFFSDRQQTRNSLAGFAYFIGAVMIVFATITRQELAAIWENAPVIEATAFNIIVYFILTLLLLSLGQFAVLRGRWGWERTPVRSAIGASWLKYSAVFFAVLFAVVLLLPTRYSLNFFQTVAVLFRFIFNILGYLVFLLMLPLMLLVARMRGEGEVEEFENPFESLRPEALPETTVVEAAVNNVSMFEWLRSALFWVVFLGIILYAFIQFARHNEVLWAKLKSIAFFNLLAEAWEKLWAWLKKTGQGAQEAAVTGLVAIRRFIRRDRPSRPWNFLSVNRLSPRLRVYFFYRALLRRAEEQGYGRLATQTPEEYRRELLERMPETAAEIDEMTAGFEAARYSRRTIADSDAARMKTAWERLRERLRRNP